MQNKSNRSALRVSLLYCLFAGGWILLSDRLLTAVIPDAQELTHYQTYKGWAFVAITAALLFYELRRTLHRREQETAERLMAQSRLRQLSQAVEQSPVSVVITDLKGCIEYVNPKFTEVTGFSYSEALGRNPRILKAGETSPATYHEMWACIKGGGTWAGEFHNQKKNGELFWEWATISPILDDAGKPTHFLAIKEDITERKRTAEALRASEGRLRSLIENAQDLIAIVDHEGILRFQSPSCKRLLDYELEQLVNHPFSEFIHPDDLGTATTAFEQALGEPARVVTCEFRFRHRDGSWRTLESIGKRLQGENPAQVVINSRDITERLRLAEQFRQAQKMEAIGQLAGGVAHDFNNILAVIQMQAGMLRLAEPVGQLQRDSALEIENAAQRGASLTRQLLLFSRRQTMQPAEVDLNEIVTNITKMLWRILGEDLRMQIVLSPVPLMIRADAGMMDQLLMNLTVNARDAMPIGGQLVIETSAVLLDESTVRPGSPGRAGSFACLSVSDTGCGIAPAILPHIFEPFFTTKAAGKGTGLGLATVFGIVQQHRGWIDVATELGRGTTFRTYLPRLAEVAANNTAAPNLDAIRGGSETILVVEDDHSLRNLVRNALLRFGYNVLDAGSGADALKVRADYAGQIHLLLTDMVMPNNMTGWELARRLGQADPSLKVVYTSGYSREINGSELVLRDGENFLAKPYQIGRLAETIRHQLDARGAK